MTFLRHLNKHIFITVSLLAINMPVNAMQAMRSLAHRFSGLSSVSSRLARMQMPSMQTFARSFAQWNKGASHPILREQDPYQTFGLSRGAVLPEVKAEYRKLVMYWHPDRNKDPRATQILQKLNVDFKTIEMALQSSAVRAESTKAAQAEQAARAERARQQEAREKEELRQQEIAKKMAQKKEELRRAVAAQEDNTITRSLQAIAAAHGALAAWFLWQCFGA